MQSTCQSSEPYTTSTYLVKICQDSCVLWKGCKEQLRRRLLLLTWFKESVWIECLRVSPVFWFTMKSVEWNDNHRSTWYIVSQNVVTFYYSSAIKRSRRLQTQCFVHHGCKVFHWIISFPANFSFFQRLLDFSSEFFLHLRMLGKKIEDPR